MRTLGLRLLFALGALTETDDTRLVAELDAELAAALAVARADRPLGRETIFDDVYARRPWHLEEQAHELG